MFSILSSFFLLNDFKQPINPFNIDIFTFFLLIFNFPLEASEIKRTVKKIRALEVTIEGAEVECQDIAGQDELLQVESSDEFSVQVASYDDKLKPFKELWFAIEDKLKHFTTWHEDPLTDLNPEEIENNIVTMFSWQKH